MEKIEIDFAQEDELASYSSVNRPTGITSPPIREFIRLMNGEEITYEISDDADIKISFNDDNEGYFFFRSKNNGLESIVRFSHVERSTEDSFFLMGCNNKQKILLKNVEESNQKLNVLLFILWFEEFDEW